MSSRVRRQVATRLMRPLAWIKCACRRLRAGVDASCLQPLPLTVLDAGKVVLQWRGSEFCCSWDASRVWVLERGPANGQRREVRRAPSISLSHSPSLSQSIGYSALEVLFYIQRLRSPAVARPRANRAHTATPPPHSNSSAAPRRQTRADGEMRRRLVVGGQAAHLCLTGRLDGDGSPRRQDPWVPIKRGAAHLPARRCSVQLPTFPLLRRPLRASGAWGSCLGRAETARASGR